MVHGLGKYVFIGGTACDLLMNDLGLPFRATKDLDIVLMIDGLDVSFGRRFWDFIEDGGYDYRSKSNDRANFYRFQKPKDPAYPLKRLKLNEKTLLDVNAFIDQVKLDPPDLNNMGFKNVSLIELTDLLWKITH
jgi:hypothetical protein